MGDSLVLSPSQPFPRPLLTFTHTNYSVNLKPEFAGIYQNSETMKSCFFTTVQCLSALTLPSASIHYFFYCKWLRHGATICHTQQVAVMQVTVNNRYRCLSVSLSLNLTDTVGCFFFFFAALPTLASRSREQKQNQWLYMNPKYFCFWFSSLFSLCRDVLTKKKNASLGFTIHTHRPSSVVVCRPHTDRQPRVVGQCVCVGDLPSLRVLIIKAHVAELLH